MKPKLFICFLLFLSNSVLNIEPNEEIIDLKDEEHSLPSPDDSDIFYIPILHTNDIHGSFYPKKIVLPNNEVYTIGGLEYMGKYASIMLKQWGNRFLYFDTGDQFQGGIEGHISNGEIIMDFLNNLQVKNSVLGNHEFDWEIPFLKEYMKKANFDWIVDNIKNTTSGQYITFPKQKRSIIIEVGDKNGIQIKLGIIGLTTKETPASSSAHMDDLIFEDYVKIINEQSKKLKLQGADAIIVIGHLGLYCRNDPNEIKLSYKLRDNSTYQENCSQTDEAYKLLNKLDKGVIDLFLAGHKHDVTHHWINGFPVMSNDRNGKYAQIVYLPFNKHNKTLIKEKIVMEGPLPICEKIFKKRKICDLPVASEKDYEEYGNLSLYKFHDQIIEKELNMTKIAEKYINIFNEYDKDLLTKNYDHLELDREKENSLGDFYTDFFRHVSGADIAIVNGGTFRTPLYRGNLTNASIFSFDPFNNHLVKFKAYGREVIRMFRHLQQSSKGFYPFSGLRMIVRNKPTKKLLSIKLWDGYKEENIQEDKLYTIVSNSFCFPLEEGNVGGDDFEKIYEWFRPREGIEVVIDGTSVIRDILINYLRHIQELKANKYYDEKNLRLRVINKE